MQSAQAGLAAAQAELTRAQAEEARQSALLKDGFTTKQRYDTAVRDLQTAEAQRDVAEPREREAVFDVNSPSGSCRMIRRWKSR